MLWRMYMNKTKLELVNSMGIDMDVASAARVSFNKSAADYSELANTKLIGYLATHNHWTPFCTLQMTITCDINLALHAQLVKSSIGAVTNTVSRRYVKGALEFDSHVWRGMPENGIKQGSGDEMSQQETKTYIYDLAIAQANNAYEALLAEGVAPEMARYVLPVGLMTRCTITGSLPYFARVYGLRTGPGAQKCWIPFCEQLDEICTKLWPISWDELTKERV